MSLEGISRHSHPTLHQDTRATTHDGLGHRPLPVNLSRGSTHPQRAGRMPEAHRFGHPSGTLRVGAAASQVNGQWTVTKAIMSRSARVLMEGWVRVPGDAI